MRFASLEFLDRRLCCRPKVSLDNLVRLSFVRAVFFRKLLKVGPDK